MRTPFRSSVEPLESRRYLAAVTLTADAATRHQTIDSFGAAMISWTGRPEYLEASFYDTLTNDLGATALRAPVWPTFERANDNDDPNTFNWSAYDPAAMAVTMQFFQRMKERGAHSFLLSVWTPPFWMKSNQTHKNGGSLRSDMYAEFAEYLAAYVIVARDTYGIEIDAVSIQNEPHFTERYESAFYDNVMMREAVRAVDRKFRAEGLAETTSIVISEDLGNTNIDRWNWYLQPTMADPETRDANLIFGTHYTDPSVMGAQWNAIKNYDRPHWYTEISGKNPDWAGGIGTARELSDALTLANINAYFYWQYSDVPSPGTPAIMGNGQPNAKYQTLKHYYRYVRPGAERVTSTSNIGDVKIAAFQHPQSGDDSIVLLNNLIEEAQVTLNLTGTGWASSFRAIQSVDGAYHTELAPVINADGTLTLTMPAKSLVTLFAGTDLTPRTGQAGTQFVVQHIDDSANTDPARWAAINDDRSALNNLIAQNHDLNLASATGWRSIHLAAASPWYAPEQTLQLLINAGADPLAVTNEGFTPLHVVAMNQQTRWGVLWNKARDRVRVLTAAGVDVNQRDVYGRTALHWAAMAPKWQSHNTYDPSFVQELIDQGVDVGAQDNFGRTAYDYALEWNRLPILPLLAGANAVHDTDAPRLKYAGFEFERHQGVEILFAENVIASLDAGDVTIRNLTTNTTLAAGAFTLTDTFSFGQSFADIRFNARLADGRYRLTIPAGAFTDANGVANEALSYDFAVLAGDTNRDGRVDFTDLLTFAANYRKAGTFSQGDFDYDGQVGFSDLLILAANYRTSLPAIASSTSSTPPKSRLSDDVLK